MTEVENSTSRRPVAPAWWLALFLAMVLPVVVWPGDVSWTNDEPRLLAAAWHANRARALATGGLYGNFGLRYGPLPTQIYQALLLVAPDPIALAALRSALCAGVTAFALLWLARTLGLAPWFALALALAPHVWLDQRILWDASFTIPLGALALAAAAAFFRRATRGRLLLTIAATVPLPLIHPQALPLALAIGGALVWRGHREVRRHWVGVLLVLAAIAALHAVYLVEVTGALFTRLGSAVRTGYPAAQSHATTALAPLLGGTLFSEAHFGGNVISVEHLPAFWWPAAWLSRLVFPLSWAGLAVAAALAFRRCAGGEEPLARRAVARVLLATLALQALIFGLMRVPAEPQYFFGTFAAHALLPWLAVDALRWRKVGALLSLTYGSAVAALTLGGMLTIHLHGYAAEPPRAMLADQLAIVRKLSAFADTTAQTEAPVYQRFPQALRALRLLVPVPDHRERPTSGHLLIRQPPGSHRLELVEEATPRPGSDSAPLDLTPLPRDWQPPESGSDR